MEYLLELWNEYSGVIVSFLLVTVLPSALVILKVELKKAKLRSKLQLEVLMDAKNNADNSKSFEEINKKLDTVMCKEDENACKMHILGDMFDIILSNGNITDSIKAESKRLLGELKKQPTNEKLEEIIADKEKLEDQLKLLQEKVSKKVETKVDKVKKRVRV